VRALSIETRTHGRVLVEDAAAQPAAGAFIAFHGYGQSADEALADVLGIPGASAWTVAAVQGLHRFYSRNDERVIASWMTRQDRDDAIADNVGYVNRVVETLQARGPLVFIGFSQGASMAYRAALLGGHEAAGIIALGGDIPPEVKRLATGRRWPPVLVGAGENDAWYTPPKMDADVEFLARSGVVHGVVRFRGGHEWTTQFREVAGRWIQRVIQAAAASSA